MTAAERNPTHHIVHLQVNRLPFLEGFLFCSQRNDPELTAVLAEAPGPGSVSALMVSVELETLLTLFERK